MELENPSNGESEAGLGDLNNGEAPDPPPKAQWFLDDIDSSCSTPYASAPSSPGRVPVSGGYFFSAPASPMHFVLSSPPYSAASPASGATELSSGSFEFDFSATYPSAGAAVVGSMISADELFHNGQIRPMKLSSHLQRPQTLAPLLDVDVEYEDEDEEGKDKGEASMTVVRGRELRMRSRSMHRRTRSMSPLRKSRLQWQNDENEEGKAGRKDLELDLDLDLDRKQAEEAATPSESASSSRSSSSGRNSKKWIFLKDLLYRSKSEGSAKSKEKFWHSISFSPSSKEKSKPTTPSPPPPISAPPKQQKQKKSAASSPAPSSASSKRGGSGSSSKPTNGVGKRRVPAPSPHERHYTAKRAQAEEMRKRTFLPYRQGLLGCLGFSSRSYGAMNGFARALNPVSSG